MSLYIDQYNQDGIYMVNDVCYGETPIDFILSYYLDFCTCGQPEQDAELIRDVLRHVQECKELLWTEQITYEQWAERATKIAPDNCMQVIYKLLDSKNLLEHGGGVPGWLTPLGEDILSDLNEILKEG